jgi:hypothetical protein
MAILAALEAFPTLLVPADDLPHVSDVTKRRTLIDLRSSPVGIVRAPTR